MLPPQQKEVAPTSDNKIPPIAYQLPIHDECAPDLYLPLMSGITYVLLSALMYGTAGKFNPEVIPSVTTFCFFVQAFEVAAIRLGFYLMQSQVAILDLFSYTGYKYVGLCINMIVGIVFGHNGLFGFSATTGTRGYYIMFLWTASAASYAMLKTMANNIPLRTTAAPGPKRELMVIVFGLSQFAVMWFVGQTKFL
jgi:protein transport protein YIF1